MLLLLCPVSAIRGCSSMRSPLEAARLAPLASRCLAQSLLNQRWLRAASVSVAISSLIFAFGCSSSRIHTASLEKFPNLNLSIETESAASPDASGAVTPRGMVVFLRADDGCVGITAETKASLNGQALKVRNRGGYVAGPAWSGHGGRCDWPSFEVPALAPETAVSVITISDERTTITMEIDALLASRVMSLASDTLSSERDGVVHWSPSTDVLDFETPGSGFTLARDEDRTPIPAGDVRRGRDAIHFKVPPVPAGAYTLAYSPQVRAAVRLCDAPGGCSVALALEASVPVTIE